MFYVKYAHYAMEGAFPHCACLISTAHDIQLVVH